MPLIIPATDGNLYYYDTLFNFMKKRPIANSTYDVIFYDVDLDNEKEIIVPNLELNTLTIYRSNFTQPATIKEINLGSPAKTRYSLSGA